MPASQMSPTELLAEMKSVVSYLRVDRRQEVAQNETWLPCERLVDDGSYLLTVVRSTAQGRGTDRDDLALSLFAQAYAFRIASIAIGSQVTGARMLDVSPSNLAIAIGRNRPNAAAMGEVRFAEEPADVGLWDRHLSPFVATAHEVASTEADSRVGMPLLWGNIATGCAAALGAFGLAGPTTEAFFASAPEPVRAAGSYAPSIGEDGESNAVWARNSCCLWYQIPNDEPTYCSDCPRKPNP